MSDQVRDREKTFAERGAFAQEGQWVIDNDGVKGRVVIPPTRIDLPINVLRVDGNRKVYSPRLLRAARRPKLGFPKKFRHLLPRYFFA